MTSATSAGTKARRAAVVVALLGAAFLAVPGSPASAGTDPEALLREAREASEDAALAGIVEVRWREGGELRAEETSAHGRGGAYVVGRGDHIAFGAKGAAWATDDGIATRWGRIDGDEAPRPGATWRLELAEPGKVAGREAYVVVAIDDGTERARFYVDKEEGLLLRRDTLQPDGALERSVRYTALESEGVAPPVPPTVPPGAPGPRSIGDVGPRFVAPEHLDPGFRLLGKYQHPDGTVQLFYGDGLFSLSVFQQPGDVDWDAMPDGGRRAEIDGERAKSYSTAAGTVVVWTRDDLVLTGVSDAPSDVAYEAIAAIDGGDDGVLTELVDYVLGPFGWN